MGVSKNYGTPKSSISIGFSIIFTIHVRGFSPYFWVDTHILRTKQCHRLWCLVIIFSASCRRELTVINCNQLCCGIGIITLNCRGWWKNLCTLWYVNHMGVSKNNGTPKWMVYFMENPIKMDDFGGFPPIFGNTHKFNQSWPNQLSTNSAGFAESTHHNMGSSQ